MPATDVVFSVNLNCSITTPAAGNSTSTYDAEGAMRFTIAVVLVFGVGVIGLLGIYHRRTNSEDLSDKEADEFVKGLERKRGTMDKQYRKEIMRQLVQSFFTRTLRRQSSHPRKDERSSLRPTLSEPNLLQCRSLLPDYKPLTCPLAKDSQPPCQDHLNDLCPPDPAIEARSRSQSFHVPNARPFGQIQKEAAGRAAMLNSRMPLFPNKHSDRNMGRRVFCPDLKAEPLSECQGAGDHCTVPLLNDQNREENGVGEGQDYCSLDLSVKMAGRPVVPIIMVNDVEIK